MKENTREEIFLLGENKQEYIFLLRKIYICTTGSAQYTIELNRVKKTDERVASKRYGA